MVIFSNRNYFALKQNKVEALINSGELQRAYFELNLLPSGSNADEKLERLLVLSEGYRAIINKFVESYDKGLDQLRDELKEYQGIGLTSDEINDGKTISVETLEERLELLKLFENMNLTNKEIENNEKNTPAHLSGMLDRLEEYEKIGSLEEISSLEVGYEKLKQKINNLA